MQNNRAPFNPEDLSRLPALISGFRPFGSSASQYIDNATGASTEICYLGAGIAGCITNMLVIPYAIAWSDLDDVHLRIYTDLGDVADKSDPTAGKTPGSYQLCEIPLDVLLGAAYDPTGPSATTPRSNDIYALEQSSTYICIVFKERILFENGVLVQLWNSTARVGLMFSQAFYCTGSTPVEYQGWRLKSDRNTTAFNKYATLAPNETTTFINVASDRGVMRAVFMSLKSTEVSAVVGADACLENNFKWWLNGASQSGNATVETSGTEDLFGAGMFYFACGAQGFNDWGVTYKNKVSDNEFYVEAYRIFPVGDIIWSNGAVGKWKNVPSDDDAPTVQMSLLTLYYAPK